jgi:hypothetical protein
MLAGKVVKAISAGGFHSVALCADGTAAAWGDNRRNQLATGGMTQSTLPVALPLSNGTVGLTIGGNHNLLRAADGTLSAWGDNTKGQLGDGTMTTRATPVAVEIGSLEVGARFMFAGGGAAAQHTLAVAGLPARNLTSSTVWLQNTSMNDPDHDGLPNLIEYAFGLDLNENSAGQLPQPVLANGVLTIRFTQPSGVTGITYGAEWSRTMEPGTWQDAPNTGSGTEHRFAIPATGLPQAFIRLKVTRR